MRRWLIALPLLAGCNQILGITDFTSESPDAGAPTRVIVTLQGTGTGRVHSVPAGINCPGQCSHDFEAGTMVSLVAVHDGGSLFAGWTGACTGFSCDITLTEDTSVDAEFDEASGGHNFMFVTQEVYGLDTFNPISKADDACNASAEAAGLPGDYVAWLSTSGQPAKDRIAAFRGWVRTDGLPFADTVADLTAGKIFHTPNLTASGAEISGGNPFVATGTNNDGTGTGGNCSNWSTVGGTYTAGFAFGTTERWSNESAASNCTDMDHLYCFGVGATLPVTIPAPTGRIGFISTSSWDVTSGIAMADSICATDAGTAGLGGTFKAVMATTGMTAASRFDVTGAPWTRKDGVPLALPGHTPFDGMATSMNVRADGSYQRSGDFVATGAKTPNDVSNGSNESCNDWTSNSGMFLAGFSDVNWFCDGCLAGCDGAFTRLYCFQQ